MADEFYTAYEGELAFIDRREETAKVGETVEDAVDMTSCAASPNQPHCQENR